MSDAAYKELRSLNRDHLHSLWQRAKNGEMEGLNKEERRLAQIMLSHSDEYFNQFEFADVLTDREYRPENDVNPFLHVTLHAVAEKQVADHDPIEAFQFYNAMLRKKCSPHETFHLLMGLLIKFLFPVLKEHVPFDLEGYRRLLKTCKSQRPDKIIRLIEK